MAQRQHQHQHPNNTGRIMQSTQNTIHIDLFNRALLFIANVAVNDQIFEATKKPDELGIKFYLIWLFFDIVLIGITFIPRKTAFVQDFREMMALEFSFNALYFISFLVYFKTSIPFLILNEAFQPINRIFYVLVTVRLIWPIMDKNGDYKNWPKFGIIALIASALKMDSRVSKPHGKEVLISYAAILSSILIGLVLWHFHVKNLGILQYAILVLALGKLADFSYKRSLLAQARSKRAHILAQRATRVAQEEKAKAEAQAAWHAAACEGLQVAVAQTVVEKERASAEAARASAEAAQLAQANQGLKEVVAKNETAIIYQVEFANKLQEEQAKERARLEQIAEEAIAEGNIAKLGRLMSRIMNPKHPHHSVRLRAAIEMWAHFENEDLTNESPYDALNAWALDNAKALGLMHSGEKSKTAIGRCAYVANWDYVGGAPKSEAKVSRPILREIPAENTVDKDCA